jgi:hypothetical protein
MKRIYNVMSLDVNVHAEFFSSYVHDEVKQPAASENIKPTASE